jgi:hypothetical protein
MNSQISRAYCHLSSLRQSFLTDGMASKRMKSKARSMERTG